MAQDYFAMQGVNLYVNPLPQDGIVIRSVNLDSFPYGAKSKRSGYGTLNGPLGGTINTLWSHTIGTTVYVYAQAGSVISSSLNGTGGWAVCGNGTVSGTAKVGYAALDNTMIIGDGVGSTRHTTNGTSFTNTTLAPVASTFAQYQRRIHASGTSSDVFYSVSNDATNWQTSGTSDSSSFTAPGAGIVNKIYKAVDRLLIVKTGRSVLKWDGYSLIDMSTKAGPSSPSSVAQQEDFWMHLNQQGFYGYSGTKFQILSNAIQRHIYNQENTGIADFKNPPAEFNRYDYLCAIGTVADDFTRKSINDAIAKYDFLKNEWSFYQFAHFPTAMHSYIDPSGVPQFVFGDASGQVYKLDPTATSDAGQPIASELELLFSYGAPEYDKFWLYNRHFFKPSAQANVYVAYTDTLDYSSVDYQPVGNGRTGYLEQKVPQARGKFAWVKISETSTTGRYTYYGPSLDADINKQR